MEGLDTLACKSEARPLGLGARKLSQKRGDSGISQQKRGDGSHAKRPATFPPAWARSRSVGNFRPGPSTHWSTNLQPGVICGIRQGGAVTLSFSGQKLPHFFRFFRTPPRTRNRVPIVGGAPAFISGTALDEGAV